MPHGLCIKRKRTATYANSNRNESFIIYKAETAQETITRYTPMCMEDMFPTRITHSIFRSSLCMILEG